MSDDTPTPPELPETDTAADVAGDGAKAAEVTEALLAENAELKDRVLRTRPRWKTCASAPSARWRIPAPMPSPALPATC